MKLHKKDKGTLGELKVATELTAKGYSIFKEIGDNSKIDLIAVAKDSKIYKIQVKAYTSSAGSVKLQTHKAGPGYRFRYQPEHFDVCAVYVLDHDRLLYVSSKELLAQKQAMTIRLDLPKNNQISKIRYYENYLDFEKCLGH